MLKGLSSPHLLLASSNAMRMIQNLNHLLNQNELAKLTAELDRNVVALFSLAQVHLSFATTLENKDWRQKTSRLYYAAYTARRAVMLNFNGSFSTDISDHKGVEDLPEGISNKESHTTNLKSLREDRNLADYSHLGTVKDLILKPDDALSFSTQFVLDCRTFLLQRGVAP